jgi:hypothetical protein
VKRQEAIDWLRDNRAFLSLLAGVVLFLLTALLFGTRVPA